MYQEEPNSTFTHDGKEYDLNYLLRYTDSCPPVDILVDDLTWVLEFDAPDVHRLVAADITAPVLVTWWFTEPEDKLTVIDGLHRLAKSMLLGKKTIPAKFVHYSVLDKALITK